MKQTPFNKKTDLAPIPFSEEHCHMAEKLKQAGLQWTPHVGCFIWDRDNHISVSSPFPNRIYFILNSGHFLNIFKTLEAMKEKLIWLPTWNQARILCQQLNINEKEIAEALSPVNSIEIGKDLLYFYTCILNKLGHHLS